MSLVRDVGTVLLVLGSLGHGAEPSGVEGLRQSSWARGVRIRANNRDLEFPRIAFSSRAAAIAYAAIPGGQTRVICSIGDGVRPIAETMLNCGGDPGDRVIFVDPENGACQSISYHQPRPDVLSASPDGRYVAMASERGWSTDGVKELEVSSKEFNVNMTVGAVNKALKDITHGTLRYSIWEVATARPIWEMRFYRADGESGARARFEQPWAQYAKIALPWWAIDTRPSRQGCEIGFSPDSKLFAALDPVHGVHLLNLSDGAQTHCCKPDMGNAPMKFAFLEGSSRIAVICEGGTIRLFSTSTGVEDRSHSLRLPSGASIDKVGCNFVVSPASGQIAVLKNPAALLTKITEANSSNAGFEIKGRGRGYGANQFDTLVDGRFVGIGYGCWHEVTSSMAMRQTCMYEVVDLRQTQVIRRLVRKGAIELPANDKVPIIEIEEANDVRACLGANGEIVYVQQLPREK